MPSLPINYRKKGIPDKNWQGKSNFLVALAGAGFIGVVRKVDYLTSPYSASETNKLLPSVNLIRAPYGFELFHCNLGTSGG